MSKAKETMTRINDILEERKSQLDKLEELKEAEEKAVKTANDKMEAATTAGDLKAYQAAKAERRDALDAKEMHSKRYEALTKKPLITREEYNKLCDEVLEECATLDNQALKELAELAEKMHTIGKKLNIAIVEANETLTKLQKDIYKNADRTRAKNGNIINLQHEDKRYNNFDTIKFASVAINCPVYERYTEKKVTE